MFKGCRLDGVCRDEEDGEVPVVCLVGNRSSAKRRVSTLAVSRWVRRGELGRLLVRDALTWFQRDGIRDSELEPLQTVEKQRREANGRRLKSTRAGSRMPDPTAAAWTRV